MLSNDVNQKRRIGTKKFFLRHKREQKKIEIKLMPVTSNLSNNFYKSDSNTKEHILQTVFLSAQVYRGTKPYLCVDAMYY